MENPQTNPASILAFDIGTIHTRAMVFGQVGERYRLEGLATSPTTASAPFRNITVGLQSALETLQSTTGRLLLDAGRELIKPRRRNGAGVDACVATVSAGPPIRVVAIGLLEDASSESALHLAASTYSGQIMRISHQERQQLDKLIDELLYFRPELVIIAGGTDDGASSALLRLLEPVRIACSLMPTAQRPEVLFAGNQKLRPQIQAAFDELASLHFAANLRPSLDEEQLEPALAVLFQLTNRIRARQLPGLSEIQAWTEGNILPTAAGLGRIVRFLSTNSPTKKRVLSVDVGVASTSLVAAFHGELRLAVSSWPGWGESLTYLEDQDLPNHLSHWLTVEVRREYVREYLYNRALHPGTLPITREDIAIEGALARLAMQRALSEAAGRLLASEMSSRQDFLPPVEPILVGGSVLTRQPNLAESGLMLLDGLQPSGTTTLILDPNHLAPALGALAGLNSLMAIQVLDSDSFLHLGTVISPVGNAPPGTPILNVKVASEDGEETSLEVKQGDLITLPLPVGKFARLQLQPYHRYDIGMGGAGRGGMMKAVGGALGVIIDGRGRPLKLPSDPDQCLHSNQTWLKALGG